MLHLVYMANEHSLHTVHNIYFLIMDHQQAIKYQSESHDTINDLETDKKYTEANKADMYKQTNYIPVLHL